MDEPNCPTGSVPELPNEINGQPNDDKEEVPMEIVMDDESSPARLAIKGFDDENEETVIMTVEEAQNYISSKVETYIRDPTTNPLLVLKNQILDLQGKIKNKSDEFLKLNKMFDALYRDQVKFLRHIGVMPRLETQTLGVSVDLPWLPDSMPGLIREDLLKNNSDRVFMQPGTTGANATTAARPAKKEPSGPIECIDLTDDGDTPDPPASTPSSSASAPTPASVSQASSPGSSTRASTPGSSTRATTPGSSARASTPASSTPTPIPSSDTPTPTPASGTSTPTPANNASTPISASAIPLPAPASGSSTPTLAATTTADSSENKSVIITNKPTSSNVPAQNIPLISGIRQNLSQHPVPLPSAPANQGKESEIPPKPRLKISVDRNGIVLQWDMPPESKNMKIDEFEIVGYQEKNNVPATSSLWKKIGCVNPMPLPMSCTLTQFVEGYKYHFSIRAHSKDNKIGYFSDPASIMFVPDTKKN